MQHLPEDECARFIEGLRNRETCQWCRHPGEPVRPKLRLCNHCNYMRLKLRKLESATKHLKESMVDCFGTCCLMFGSNEHMIENC